jgi:hypothetical protein
MVEQFASSDTCGGDLDTVLAEHATDRLDPIMAGTHLIDEPADQRWRGSSSLAKKIEAAFKISLASFRSRTSARSRRISSSSSLVGPLRCPPSTWACTIHLRSV